MTAASVTPAKRGVRTDIQALRALAVLAVVFSHYFPVRAVGGFIGVDVFFVVSGFLITAHLMRELDATGRVKLGRFYARRARRLLPAAYVVLTASLLGALLLLPVSRWNDTAKEVFASAAYFQNWLLADKAADPLGSGASATVVRHYWSLSVEEQFYLIWPIVLIAGFALAVRYVRSPRLQRLVIGGILAAIGLFSFWAAVVVTDSDLTVAYFVTYSRVWEFVVGGLLALAAPALERVLARRVVVRSLMQWAGVGMILWAIATFDTDTAFPGPWAALPVFGAALVIAAGPAVPRFTPMYVGGVRPVQMVGDISYSIYLWHFPLFVLAPFVIGRELGSAERLLLIVISIALAWVTSRYIEQPARGGLLIKASLPKFFGVMVVTIALFGLVAFPVGRIGGVLVAEDRAALAERAQLSCFGAGALQEGCDDPFAATDLLVVGASEGPKFKVEQCDKFAHRSKLMRCDFSDGDAAAKQVWLLGDGGVKNWKPALLELAEREGWVITMDSKGGCPVLEVGAADLEITKAVHCREKSAANNRLITEEEPDLVIVAQEAAKTIDEIGGSDSASQKYAAEVGMLVESWIAAGAQVAAIRDVPQTLSTATPECLEINESNPIVCAADRAEALPDDPFTDAVDALGNSNANVVDMSEYFCDVEQCYALIGGLPVNFDERHLSRSYSETLAPSVGEQLLPMLR